MSDVPSFRQDEPLYKQLTCEIIEPSSNGSVAVTIIGAVLMTLLINWAALWYLETYPANRGYWLVKQKWDMLLSLEGPTDWLVLGDSSGNQGIVPDRLEGNAVNLCTVASITMLDDVWMLQLYIDKFGPPQRVLIVHTYDMWPRDVAHVFLAKASIPWRAWDRLLPGLELDAKQELDVFLTRYAPVYAENKTLSKIIYDGVFGPEPLFEKLYQLEANGHMPLLSPAPDRVLADAEDHIKSVSGRDFRMSDINQAAMEQMMAIAERYELDVYVVNSPLYEGLAENATFQGYYAGVQASLRGYDERSDYLHFLDVTAVFPAEEMENVDHVIESAAVRYTEMIAEAIARAQ